MCPINSIPSPWFLSVSHATYVSSSPVLFHLYFFLIFSIDPCWLLSSCSSSSSLFPRGPSHELILVGPALGARESRPEELVIPPLGDEQGVAAIPALVHVRDLLVSAFAVVLVVPSLPGALGFVLAHFVVVLVRGFRRLCRVAFLPPFVPLDHHLPGRVDPPSLVVVLELGPGILGLLGGDESGVPFLVEDAFGRLLVEAQHLPPDRQIVLILPGLGDGIPVRRLGHGLLGVVHNVLPRDAHVLAVRRGEHFADGFQLGPGRVGFEYVRAEEEKFPDRGGLFGHGQAQVRKGFGRLVLGELVEGEGVGEGADGPWTDGDLLRVGLQISREHPILLVGSQPRQFLLVIGMAQFHLVEIAVVVTHLPRVIVQPLVGIIGHLIGAASVQPLGPVGRPSQRQQHREENVGKVLPLQEGFGIERGRLDLLELLLSQDLLNVRIVADGVAGDGGLERIEAVAARGGASFPLRPAIDLGVGEDVLLLGEDVVLAGGAGGGDGAGVSDGGGAVGDAEQQRPSASGLSLLLLLLLLLTLLLLLLLLLLTLLLRLLLLILPSLPQNVIELSSGHSHRRSPRCERRCRCRRRFRDGESVHRRPGEEQCRRQGAHGGLHDDST
mmetsp:Transcript_43806/g.133321  ORF Transcript_43806/g.133321 Transcript_43806/m.133321 type:complete len:611 (-) Transcript_43806:56-1888(-)